MIIGLKTSLLLAKVAAAGLSGASGLGGIGGAAKVAAGGVGAAAGLMVASILGVMAVVASLIIMLKTAIAWEHKLGASGGGKKGIGGIQGGPALPVHQKQSGSITPGISYTKTSTLPSQVKSSTTGVGAYAGKKSFDTGGIVPGPIGSPQLILAHGGETVLPTHKANWQGSGGNTIRHELDLINVPATVDEASLERTLVEMLNAPQVKRKIDRVNYENQIGAVRGLGA
jgi:hypothetical protein